jgi:hypothetical protein
MHMTFILTALSGHIHASKGTQEAMNNGRLPAPVTRYTAARPARYSHLLYPLCSALLLRPRGNGSVPGALGAGAPPPYWPRISLIAAPLDEGDAIPVGIRNLFENTYPQEGESLIVYLFSARAHLMRR